MRVELIRKPTKADWEWMKRCTLNTVGVGCVTSVTEEWKKKMLLAEHSPIREIWFGIRMEIPYYVSVHFVRHNIGVNHYVQSQRNDRQKKYDRREARQDATVSHIMSINAQELIFMAHKRLCGMASSETREVMEKICEEVIMAEPVFNEVLEPLCEYRNGKCTEIKGCGRNDKR